MKKTKDATHSQAPKIDVMSEDFHKSFMQKDTRDSYMGIKPGMTRAEVEKRYGSSNRVFHKNRDGLSLYHLWKFSSGL